MIETPDKLQRLAEAVRQRRGYLGLAQGDLAEVGGPSIVTVGQIERCAIQQPQTGTLKKIDTALQWAPGSAARILAGGEPVPLEQPKRPTAQEASEQLARLSRDELERVVRLGQDPLGETPAGLSPDEAELIAGLRYIAAEDRERVISALRTVLDLARSRQPADDYELANRTGRPALDIKRGEQDEAAEGPQEPGPDEP